MFGMSWHAMFDCFFPIEVRDERKFRRALFQRLALVPTDRWKVSLRQDERNDLFPAFVCETTAGGKIYLWRQFYARALIGVDCYVTFFNKDDSFALRGHCYGRDEDFPPYCGYVDWLYGEFCHRLKSQIEDLRRARLIIQETTSKNHRASLERN